MARRCDEHTNHGGQYEEAASVDEVGVFTDLPEEPQDREQSDDTHEGDHSLRSTRQLPGESPGAPHHGQCRTEQEPHDVTVRAEVGTAGISLSGVAVGDGEKGHPQGRGECAPDGHVEDGSASLPAQQEKGEKRPDEIELLLDREGPQVLEERRSTDRLEVRSIGDDIPPVRDVQQGSDSIGAECCRGIAVDEGSEHSHHDEQEQEGG